MIANNLGICNRVRKEGRKTQPNSLSLSSTILLINFFSSRPTTTLNRRSMKRRAATARQRPGSIKITPAVDEIYNGWAKVWERGCEKQRLICCSTMRSWCKFSINLYRFIYKYMKTWQNHHGPGFVNSHLGPEAARKRYHATNLPSVSPIIQRSAKVFVRGLVNFVLALAYHFCLNLPAAFTQPRARLLVEPCN